MSTTENKTEPESPFGRLVKKAGPPHGDACTDAVCKCNAGKRFS